MKSVQIAARPTEYQGVVFRSKCEAILARALDLSQILWEYEPQRFAVDDWVPDFFISYRVIVPGAPGPKIVTAVLEYKPSPVTETYKAELYERLWASTKGQIQVLGMLLVGNPFDSSVPRSIFSAYRDGTWGGARSMLCIFDKFDEAKSHRFDLAKGWK